MYAQTLEETYARAEAFSAQGQYEEALKLYRRILFFTEESDTLKPQFYAAAGKAFLELRLYEKSVEYYSNAVYLSGNEYLIQNWRLQKIKALLLHHQYDLAKKELQKIDTIKFHSLIRSVNFYTGVYYFGIESYDSTHKYFTKLIGNNAEKQDQLDKLFRKNQRIKYTAPQVAAIMSVIIPGSGQIYSGNFDRGMQSFLLTSAFAVLGYNTYAAYGLIEALVSVSPWHLRYYTSGIKNAKQLARQKQAQKRQKVLSEMLILLPAE
ncbi:MAG: tetratricopeptide repeat protein [Bacteroidia bacterium]